jgi:DNA-binding NtrC family response regulator
LRRWEREPWPGNVRQLRNAVARTVALDGFDECDGVNGLHRLDAGESSKLAPPSSASVAPRSDWLEQILAERMPLALTRERVVREFERRYLEHALARHEGNVTRAAKESGVALRYFQLLRARQRS